LETTAESINAAGDMASDFLKTVLSSVTSPGPLDVVIIYQNFDFINVSPPISPYSYSQEMSDKVALNRQRQPRVFREMHSARDFHLVLCADVTTISVRRVMEMLEPIVKAEEVEGGLDYIPYRPLIIFERRMLRNSPDINVGRTGKWHIQASAL
jgi:hypothetical protein